MTGSGNATVVPGLNVHRLAVHHAHAATVLPLQRAVPTGDPAARSPASRCRMEGRHGSAIRDLRRFDLERLGQSIAAISNKYTNKSC